MAGIIRQGVSEGIFDTMYSEEAAQAFFAISNALGSEMYEHPDDPAGRRRLESALYLFERLLGAEPGAFDFYGKPGAGNGGNGAKGAKGGKGTKGAKGGRGSEKGGAERGRGDGERDSGEGG